MSNKLRNENELTGASKEERLLTTAGLAARARKAVIGTNLLCEVLKDGSILLVLEASDTSENTHKRLCDRTRFYGVRRVRLSVDGVRLGRAFGKTAAVAAVGITDSGIVRALERYLPAPASEEKDAGESGGSDTI